MTVIVLGKALRGLSSCFDLHQLLGVSGMAHRFTEICRLSLCCRGFPKSFRGIPYPWHKRPQVQVPASIWVALVAPKQLAQGMSRSGRKGFRVSLSKDLKVVQKKLSQFCTCLNSVGTTYILCKAKRTLRRLHVRATFRQVFLPA